MMPDVAMATANMSPAQFSVSSIGSLARLRARTAELELDLGDGAVASFRRSRTTLVPPHQFIQQYFDLQTRILNSSCVQEVFSCIQIENSWYWMKLFVAFLKILEKYNACVLSCLYFIFQMCSSKKNYFSHVPIYQCSYVFQLF